MRQLEFSFFNGSNSFQDLLHSLFIYKKGRLFYRVTPKCLGGSTCKNVEAGYKLNGYKKINIKNKHYMVHHIIFIMHHGDSVLEKLKHGFKIDHKDCNKLNNKIENLRVSTSGQNASNSKAKRKRKLPKGIYLGRWKGFVAKIRSGDKKLEKTFLSIDEAVSWRNWIGQKLHAEFFRGD